MHLKCTTCRGVQAHHHSHYSFFFDFAASSRFFSSLKRGTLNGNLNLTFNCFSNSPSGNRREHYAAASYSYFNLINSFNICTIKDGSLFSFFCAFLFYLLRFLWPYQFRILVLPRCAVILFQLLHSSLPCVFLAAFDIF